MAGQTINDRLLAAKHSLAGQGLAKSVCKATTEEMLGPKKKHLDYLVHCTNEPNVSIPQMANLLIERSQNTSWVVVFKSLITTHHLMCYGNERFTQFLASSNVSFQLSNFVDKTGVQSAVGARTGYDMSPFIRRYAKYLNEKALSYRGVAFDFCKVKRGKEEGTLRTMDAENLLKTLPILQNQLDALLEFDCTANDLTNGVINMCFMLLFRDLIRLFACYNDGIINLLEKYFELNKKQCREALDLYKKFLIRMDRVAEFLKVAENIGIDKGDIPDLTRAPNSLLDALEQHLASLEGNTPTAAANQKNLKTGVTALSNTSTAFGSALDETTFQQVVAEEEAVFSQFRAQVGSPGQASTNPFLSEEDEPQSGQILDLFGGEAPLNSAPAPASHTGTAIDDLLSLGELFPLDKCPEEPKVRAKMVVTSVTGDVAEVDCHPPYRNELSPCQPVKFRCENGRWEGVYPECVMAYACAVPASVHYSQEMDRNFEVTYDAKGKPYYPINGQINYECLKGYSLVGSAVISCQTNGCWQPRDLWPKCVRTNQMTADYFAELNNINAIFISTATGAGVLGVLLLACLVVACKKRRALLRAAPLPPPTVNDHTILLQNPDRLALIAFADGVPNTNQNALPSYDEATRDTSTVIQVSRLQIQRPHWPNLTVCRTNRSRATPQIDHVPRHGSFGSTDTVTISEGSTNVTLDTASSHSAASHSASCRGHCGSLTSFDACSMVNNEGIPLLEENEDNTAEPVNNCH